MSRAASGRHTAFRRPAPSCGPKPSILDAGNASRTARETLLLVIDRATAADQQQAARAEADRDPAAARERYDRVMQDTAADRQEAQEEYERQIADIDKKYDDLGMDSRVHGTPVVCPTALAAAPATAAAPVTPAAVS
ncbi:hypothetical protein ACFZAG_39295 [Streptomyces sp. NPDC012403]|uniref:hypothetical protein n=1 Tax=Streptomyces sp. NPDC012403 TaxID=3364831 RepID=UPI0036E17EF4